MLKLFDHDVLFFGSENKQGFYVDTSDVSNILLGAFEKLFERTNRNSSSIGFRKEPHRECTYDNTEITLDIEFVG